MKKNENLPLIVAFIGATLIIVYLIDIMARLKIEQDRKEYLEKVFVTSMQEFDRMATKAQIDASTIAKHARPTRPIQAEYPPVAFSNGVEGTVWLEIETSAIHHTRPISIRIARSSGNSALDRSAVMAAEEARFIPAISKNGHTLPDKIDYPIAFRINR